MTFFFSLPYQTSGRRSGRRTISGESDSKSGPFSITISGVPSGSDTDFFSFLEKKASRPFKIIDSHRDTSDVLHITVENYSQSLTLLKLSGIRYSGNKVNP